MIELLVYYLIAINFLAFVAFGIDKMQAEAGGWRVSEARLVHLAALGGWPGAYAGRGQAGRASKRWWMCALRSPARKRGDPVP